MKLALILSALTIALSPPSSFGQARSRADGGKASREVKRALRQVEEASVKMDRASLERLLADDFTFANAVGVASTKRQHIEAFDPARFMLVSVVTDVEGVRVYGDTAVVTLSSQRGARVGGMDVSGRYRSLMVFVKRGGRWQLAAQQDTRVAQGRP